jgi:hypothetical protein
MSAIRKIDGNLGKRVRSYRAAIARRRRVRVEDLVLGMYVAEPEGIWTPLGTVTTTRVAKRRRVVGGQSPQG